jgi:hypothetical protein
MKVNNTTKDITHTGPVAQELALHKGAILFADVTDGTTTEPLSMGMMKQAAMGSTIFINFSDTSGNGLQNYTLNKATGAPNGSVARALIDQLNLKRVGDCALLHFFACQRLMDVFATVVVVSDDTSVLSNGLILYNGDFTLKQGGEALLEIRAVNVTPGAELVFLFVSSKNAFR